MWLERIISCFLKCRDDDGCKFSSQKNFWTKRSYKGVKNRGHDEWIVNGLNASSLKFAFSQFFSAQFQGPFLSSPLGFDFFLSGDSFFVSIRSPRVQTGSGQRSNAGSSPVPVVPRILKKCLKIILWIIAKHEYWLLYKRKAFIHWRVYRRMWRISSNFFLLLSRCKLAWNLSFYTSFSF